MIKSSYKKVTLKEIVSDMHQGINTAADKVEYVSSGMPIIQSRNFTSGVLELNETKFIGIEDKKRYGEKYKPRKGDVLFSNIGTVGKSVVIEADSDFLFAWNVFLIRPNSTELYSRYLQHYLNYLLGINFYERWFTGGTVKFLNKKTIADFEIPLPPLAEQQKIAAILDAADSLRQKDQQLVERYTALSQSLFLDMFGDPVTNPMGWEKIALIDTVPKVKNAIVDGPFGSSIKKQDYADEGIPIIRINNIRDEGYYDDEYKFISIDKYHELSRSKVSFNDLLIARVGNTIGKTCIFNRKFEALLSTTCVAKATLDSERFNIHFINKMMSLSSYKQYIQSQVQGAGQPYLNLTQIKAFIVINVPFRLQNQFADRIQLIEVQNNKRNAV